MTSAKPGIVLHVGGDHELPARLQPGDQDRLQVGARGIDRRRIAGRAGADDQDAGVMGVAHAHTISVRVAGGQGTPGRPPGTALRSDTSGVRKRDGATRPTGPVFQMSRTSTSFMAVPPPCRLARAGT